MIESFKRRAEARKKSRADELAKWGSVLHGTLNYELREVHIIIDDILLDCIKAVCGE